MKNSKSLNLTMNLGKINTFKKLSYERQKKKYINNANIYKFIFQRAVHGGGTLQSAYTSGTPQKF